MELEDLPEDLREAFENLKHGSATIEADINDALETTSSIEDFNDRVDSLMTDLVREAEVARATFGTQNKIVLDAVKFLGWINGAKRMNVKFRDIGEFKTLWDIPDLILPKSVFISGFETACKRLSNDSKIVRIADEAAKCMGVEWKNIPDNSEEIDGKPAELAAGIREAHGNIT